VSILVLKLPDVKRKAEERPKECPYCAGETIQRWGQVKKPVKDMRCRNVRVYRYRCCRCGRTFRHYPAGTTRADQTERLRMFAVICWRMGLSYRGVSTILSGLRTWLCPMTVWRDAQEQKLRRHNEWKPVRVLGLDGAYVLGWGEKRPVLVAVDLGEGQPVAVGYVDEHDPVAVQRWLEPLVQKMGISVIVTNDLFIYKMVAQQPNLEHQICQFHVRRWVGRTLKELGNTLPKEWLWVLAEIKELMEELPPDGNKRLYALWKQVKAPGERRIGQYTAFDHLIDLLIRLSETWPSFCTFYNRPLA
jgi:hypothetical protein